MGQEDKVRETAIDNDRVEAIRASSSDTRELVRKLASYLFLECGTYPSANKVLGLAKRGSMVTITDELDNWWEILRRRARPLLAAPDLPEALRDQLAAFGTELWVGANEAARSWFEGARVQLEEQAQSALRRAEDLNLQNQALKLELAAAHEDKHALHARLSQREDALAEAQQTSAMLQNEVNRRTQENRETQERLATAQSEFSKELDKQRDTISKIEQRAADDLRRQHAEVDRARQETVRKNAELAQAKEALERANAAAHSGQKTADKQISDLRERINTMSSERALAEAGLQTRIATLETQLTAKADLLDATKQSLQASEARERATAEELSALRARLERLLEERAATQEKLATSTEATGEKPSTPSPEN